MHYRLFEQQSSAYKLDQTGKFVMSFLLYVDFDGVLHPSTGKDLFCRMHLLEGALIGKDCQIIISTSWRFHHPFKYLQSLFPESLLGQVAGVTGDAFVGRWPRHSEILIDVSKRAGRWGPWMTVGLSSQMTALSL